MDESPEPLSAVPRHINLTGERLRRKLPGIPERRKPLSFYPLAWLLFLFCWLVFEILRAWIFTGGFVFNSEKGLDLVLPDFTVTVEDLLKLQSGIPLETPDVDPSRDRFVVLEVTSSGSANWNGRSIDLEKPIPWATTKSEARETIVFIRPLPGATYGSVVRVLDQLRSQWYLWEIEVFRVHLVKCESGPSGHMGGKEIGTSGEQANGSTIHVIEAP
jgi:biopolymer transport protein ExbD